MFARLVTQLRAVATTQRRTVSEYAKSFGYKFRKNEIPEPSINPLKIALCYGGAVFLMYDVIQDRKAHYKTFIENREEGREYLELLPSFNRFTPYYFPPVDRFLKKETPQLDIKEPELSTVIFDAMSHVTMKDNPKEWKEDDTSYVKK